MIIFDDEIMEASAELMHQAKEDLTIIFYTISPYKNTNPIRYRNWWIALIQTAKRLPKTRVILSGWHPTNPQNLATLQAAIQLREAGALVKIGSPHMIIHPKAMCFDTRLLLNGSHNATEAGFTRTKNVSITTTDELAIGRFMDYFQNRWDSIA